VSQAHHYILELDGESNVIGGQWLSNEKTSVQPSYLWIAQGPRFQRSLNKTSPEAAAPGNPYVRYSEVLDLLNQSKAEEDSNALELQTTAEGNSDPLPE